MCGGDHAKRTGAFVPWLSTWLVSAFKLAEVR
jgi:hypothetical protein